MRYTLIVCLTIFLLTLIAALYNRGDNLSIGAPATSTTTVDTLRAQYEIDLVTSQEAFFAQYGKYDGKNVWDDTKMVLNNVQVGIVQSDGPEGKSYEIMYVVEDQYNNKGSSTIDTWMKRVRYKQGVLISEDQWLQIGGV